MKAVLTYPASKLFKKGLRFDVSYVCHVFECS